jgi:hypothetical protein
MNYCVYHSQKGKASGGPLGSHIDRESGKEHTYKNADAELTQYNREFSCPGGRHKWPMHLAVQDRIVEGYDNKRKLRTDAVKFVNHTLTGSHDKMMRLLEKPEEFEEWIKENRKFIEDEFGAENIVRFTLHLDEKTPHIHAVTVPLTERGKLSWKELAGGRKEMHLRQTNYHKRMERFGFDRGREWSGVKHEDRKEYDKRIEEAKNQDLGAILEPVKGVFGVNANKTIEKHENSIRGLKMALDESKNKEKIIDLKWRTDQDKKQDAIIKKIEQEEHRRKMHELHLKRGRNSDKGKSM